MSVALLLITLCSAAPPPSLAVMGVQAKGEFPASTAELITTAVVSELREANHFGRIATMEDLQAAVGLERQRQLLDCDVESCMVEVAGALNVDHVLTGSVGRVGGSWLFTLNIVSARSGSSAASVTERIPATSEDTLLDRIPVMARQLLSQLGAVQPAAPPATVATEEAPGGPSPLLFAGAGVAVAGVLLALPALVFLGTGFSVFTASYVPVGPVPPGSLMQRVALVSIASGIGGVAGLGAVGALLGAMALVAAAVLLG